MFRLAIILAAFFVVGGGLFIAYTDPAKLPPQIQPFAPKLKELVNAGMNSSQTALSKTKDVQPAVMGAKTESSRIFQEDTAGKPIHQQAMEFTQYEYCKMVVKNFESDQTKTTTPEEMSSTPTPSPEKN